MTITQADVAGLSPGEREQLLRMLLAAGPRPAGAATLFRRLRPRLFLPVLALTVVALLGWIGVLTATLPDHASVQSWRPVWVGFDVLEAIGLAVTLWAAWRARQVMIPAALITGTLLVSDAWFDVALSWGTNGFWSSVAAAVFVELPLAALLWLTARRMVRGTLVALRARLRGLESQPVDEPVGAYQPAR